MLDIRRRVDRFESIHVRPGEPRPSFRRLSGTGWAPPGSAQQPGWCFDCWLARIVADGDIHGWRRQRKICLACPRADAAAIEGRSEQKKRACGGVVGTRFCRQDPAFRHKKLQRQRRQTHVSETRRGRIQGKRAATSCRSGRCFGARRPRSSQVGVHRHIVPKEVLPDAPCSVPRADIRDGGRIRGKTLAFAGFCSCRVYVTVIVLPSR